MKTAGQIGTKNRGAVDNSSVSDTDNSKIEFLQYAMYGFCVVIGLGFITLLIQYFSATQATFENLKDQVVAQNAKIDDLSAQIYRENFSNQP